MEPMHELSTEITTIIIYNTHKTRREVIKVTSQEDKQKYSYFIINKQSFFRTGFRVLDIFSSENLTESYRCTK